jgi:hypothetical protein
MRVATLVMVAFAVIFGSALGSRGASGPSMVPHRDESFVRGVALGLFATDPAWDYGALVDEIRARRATDVLVVVNAYQSDRSASDIALRPGRSPTHSTVERTLSQIRRAGMRAALMPVVRLQRRAPHDWRGVIAPSDGFDAWFDSYRRLVLPLARIAERAGARRFIIGSELGSLERYEAQWRTLISELRPQFSGTLTYSANWDRAHAVGFWDALDEVGLTAYFPLDGGDETPSAAMLADAWRTPRAQIDALGQRVAKPVLITEIGYPSQRGAAKHPWDDTSAASVDLGLQRRLYRGFCDAFAQTSSISGFYVWNWFGFGGPRDSGFTPRGKPAASELMACFARPWPARGASLAGNQS